MADGSVSHAPDVAVRYGLVVEDHAETRDWLSDMLRLAFDDIEVAAASSLAEGRDRLDGWAAGDPSAFRVALVDIGLPDGSGLDLIAALLERHPSALPVVTTVFDDDAHVFDAMAAGAGGYLLKGDPPEVFVRYLRRIQGGEPPLSPAVARRLLEFFRTRPTREPVAPSDEAPALTGRETDVLRLVGRGLRVAEAAHVLGLSEHTVSGYVKAIYAKLNICSRAEAALEAARRGLV